MNRDMRKPTRCDGTDVAPYKTYYLRGKKQ